MGSHEPRNSLNFTFSCGSEVTPLALLFFFHPYFFFFFLGSAAWIQASHIKYRTKEIILANLSMSFEDVSWEIVSIKWVALLLYLEMVYYWKNMMKSFNLFSVEFFFFFCNLEKANDEIWIMWLLKSFEIFVFDEGWMCCLDYFVLMRCAVGYARNDYVNKGKLCW